MYICVYVFFFALCLSVCYSIYIVNKDEYTTLRCQALVFVLLVIGALQISNDDDDDDVNTMCLKDTHAFNL